ncbi:MAG: cysteine desulfurase family protein [Acidimicrobiales bacterium]
MADPLAPGDEAYLDNAASAPLRPVAREAWLRAVDAHHANPTGAHAAARSARRALDDARARVAEALGRHPGEVVLTSGGSEADNLAVRGVLGIRRGVAVCSAGEHHAVLDPVIAAGGVAFGLAADGRPDPGSLARVLEATSDVSVVSVMAVNNETGAVTPMAEIVEVVRERAPDALLHTDAVQAVQWIDVAEVTAGFDLVSITGHKIGGPVGTGALVVADGVELDPQILGGGQERGRRAGTPAVAGAAAFAAALDDTVEGRPDEVARLTVLRDRLLDGLLAALGDRLVVSASPTGDRAHLAGGIAHLCLRGVESEALLFLLDAAGVRASAASSCSSGAQEPSHVLAAMGIGRELALGSLRLSLGHATTAGDVERALEVIPAAVARLDRHRVDHAPTRSPV